MSEVSIFAGPDLLPIAALHRHDGYISFARKSDDDFRPVFGIRADLLENMFPEFRKQLFKDSFVSINASYRLAGNYKNRPHGWPAHRTENLRYLCACYCDIDIYKMGVSCEDALEQIGTLRQAGLLPEPSIVVRSGRGIWLLWLLRDAADPRKAHVGAYTDNPKDHLLLYTRINRAIVDRLAFIGSDPAATDGARYLRVPGSFRTDVEEVIEWSVQAGNAGGPATYTLGDLADLFGVRPISRSPQEREALNKSKQGTGKENHGHRAANRNRLAAFAALKEIRNGGFRKGCRNHAALIFALCLKWNKVSKEDAQSALLKMARLCTPQLSDRECFGAIKSAYKPSMRKMSYSWMANVLEVTPEEAAVISQRIEKPFPAANRFGGAAATTYEPGEKRDAKIARRRFEMKKIIDATGFVPSARLMRDLLLSSGIEVGHVTVAADYKAMGCVANRHTGAKKPPVRSFDFLFQKDSPLPLVTKA